MMKRAGVRGRGSALRARSRCNRTGRAMAIATLLLALGQGAPAVSVFSREGLGEWIEGYDARGEALGSTGIGVADPFNFCMLNPAATAFSPNTLVYAAMDATVDWSRDADHEARRKSGSLAGLGVHVPLSSTWGMRWTLQPRTDGVYTLRETVATGSGDPGNVRILEGSRGLLLVTGEVTCRPIRSLAAALSAGLTAGSLLDEVHYQFADSGWTNTDDQRKLRVRPAWVFGGGLLWAPVTRVAVGASASVGTRMTCEDVYRSAGGRETTSKTTLDQPLGLGGGVSVFVLERLRVSADAYWRGWEDVRLGGHDLPQPGVGPLCNTLRWGVGLERTARRSRAAGFWNQLSWRAGFAWIPWYAEDRNGQAPEERRISFGVGIPIRVDRGTLDITISRGWRGSLDDTGIAEKYLRFTFGTTFARMVREY
jgi:hypothetical protein